MDEIKERAKKYIDKIDEANRRTFVSQLEKNKQYMGRKLIESVILAGSLTSLTITLFLSNANIIKPLTAFGIFFFSVVLIIVIFVFANGMKIIGKYSLHLLKTTKILSDFSNVCTQFSRNEINVEDFLKKEKIFQEHYPDLRDNDITRAVESYDREFWLKIAQGQYSQMNIIIFCLISGVVVVVISILLPLFIC